MSLMHERVFKGLRSCGSEQLEDYADLVLHAVSTVIHLRRDARAARQLYEHWAWVEAANERAETAWDGEH
jgi:hypothetical protein